MKDQEARERIKRLEENVEKIKFGKLQDINRSIGRLADRVNYFNPIDCPSCGHKTIGVTYYDHNPCSVYICATCGAVVRCEYGCVCKEIKQEDK